jgi:hypothetical protein
MITFFRVCPVNLNVYVPLRNVNVHLPFTAPPNALLETSDRYAPLTTWALEAPSAIAAPAPAEMTASAAMSRTDLTAPRDYS